MPPPPPQNSVAENIADLLIPDEVARLSMESKALFLRAFIALNERNHFDSASASGARRLAEKANSDPSLLELLNFPSEQKYGVYVPLLLPLLVPLLQPVALFTMFLLSKHKKRRQKLADEKVVGVEQPPAAAHFEEKQKQQRGEGEGNECQQNTTNENASKRRAKCQSHDNAPSWQLQQNGVSAGGHTVPMPLFSNSAGSPLLDTGQALSDDPTIASKKVQMAQNAPEVPRAASCDNLPAVGLCANSQIGLNWRGDERICGTCKSEEAGRGKTQSKRQFRSLEVISCGISRMAQQLILAIHQHVFLHWTTISVNDSNQQ
ncbi:hypothetical protein niasHT_032836 [Heterodera trifolii]|uniref:Uncharacterized protein n=1 Tax=Heterodera trifolii TaxID=157864 RepID=A0ABD2J663_9BILA